MNPSRRLAQWLGGKLSEYVDNVDTDSLQVWIAFAFVSWMLNMASVIGCTPASYYTVLMQQYR